MIKQFNADALNVKVYDNRDHMGKSAAKEFADTIGSILTYKEEVNIIFASAPSQSEFIHHVLQETIPWKQVNVFHMDEYVGLDIDAPQGFGNFLKNALFSKVPVKNAFYLLGSAEDYHEECKRYAHLLQQYPADIVCMGIGENGHIAFNDPHVAFFDDTEVVKLVELDTVCRMQQVNDGCFSTLESVPTHALTLTIPALVQPSHILCMVPGATKRDAVKHTIQGKIGEQCPSSILRTHAHAVLYLDKESASLVI